jgi:hypothetical protein
MNMEKMKHKGLKHASHNIELFGIGDSPPIPRPNIRPGTSTLVSTGSDTHVDTAVSSPSHEQIKERARAIWIQNGWLEGQDKADWHEAEAQLKAAVLSQIE